MRPERSPRPAPPAARPAAIRSLARAAACAWVLAVAPATPGLAAGTPPQHQLEEQLMCYCGCSNLTVRACTCGTADAIRGEIAAQLAAGKTVEEVVASYVARHGEKIRSAPATSGFDLLAWVMPFALILAGGAMLVLVIRRWGARPAPAAAAPPAAAGVPPTPEERRLIDKVRKDIEDGF